MRQRNITVTLKKAKEWYNSDNATLKEIALQAFSEKELNVFDFTKIKTFKDALLCICKFNSCGYNSIVETVNRLRIVSKASAAMFMLNIVRKVLNTGYNLHLTKDADGQNRTWYPLFRITTDSCTYYNDDLKSGVMKIIGKIQSEGVTYDVLSGCADWCSYNGLGNLDFTDGVGYACVDIGIIGCATKDIAEHFGRYFGMLTIEAMYGDMVDFNIVK